MEQQVDPQLALNEAIGSVGAAIMSVLSTDQQDRFAKAERLAQIARHLQRVSASRVDEFDDGGGEGMGYAGGQPLLIQPNRPPRRPGALMFHDGAELDRENIANVANLIQLFQPYIASNSNKNMAQELSSLLAARAEMIAQKFETAEVDARIETIREQMKGTNNAAATPEDVVRP